MNLAINLSLDTEEADCLTDVVNARNASGTEVTIEQHLAEICMAEVLRYKAAAYETSVAGLGAAARALPYADRKALIAQVAAQLQS